VTGEGSYRAAWQQQETQALSSEIDRQLNADFKQALADKAPILMDMTNLTRKSRRYWLSQLPSDYCAQAILLIVSDHTINQRNQQRADKTLPQTVLDDMMLRFEHPLFDEFEQIQYAVDGRLYDLGCD
jgi:predicted kinase